MTEIGTL